MYSCPKIDFFRGFWKERKSFLEQSFSKGKGKINLALAGVQATGLVSTDFMAANILREPLEFNADVFIKIEDLTVKVLSL